MSFQNKSFVSIKVVSLKGSNLYRQNDQSLVSLWAKFMRECTVLYSHCCGMCLIVSTAENVELTRIQNDGIENGS